MDQIKAGDQNMKPATLIGIILIVLSILSFAYQGITYTTREKVVDVGPFEATAKKRENYTASAHLWRHCPRRRHRLGDCW